jgi:hypothetical protein
MRAGQLSVEQSPQNFSFDPKLIQDQNNFFLPNNVKLWDSAHFLWPGSKHLVVLGPVLKNV